MAFEGGLGGRLFKKHGSLPGSGVQAFERTPNMDFRGKIVVITGAASGIGEACVREFAARHASVAMVDCKPSPAKRSSPNFVPPLRLWITFRPT